VLQSRDAFEVIPAARRLISSLRDMGYEFSTAIADLVDNSIEAGATKIDIDVEFEGEESWVRIADNGRGMTPAALREALRYGSTRDYAREDLGKFGLGMKVASLSQCRHLTVASRTNPDRADISAYCWDLNHIEKTNRWELLAVQRDEQTIRVFAPLRDSIGTVVLWRRLDRILGYQHPDGESARRRFSAMAREAAGHLSMVFHRLLAGDAVGRKLTIRLNGTPIDPWDPFARDEVATRQLAPLQLQVIHGSVRGTLALEPFVLPHQSAFSSPDAFRRASGPANWNQQQGFYVYRANRLIQAGGWCRIRTLDEHTKLARVALRFSPQLDEALRVNVSKMRVEIPSGMREQISELVAPVLKLANAAYRKNGGGGHVPHQTRTKPSRLTLHRIAESLLAVATAEERKVIRRVVARLDDG
jgi:hypothetical protein